MTCASELVADDIIPIRKNSANKGLYSFFIESPGLESEANVKFLFGKITRVTTFKYSFFVIDDDQVRSSG